MSNMNSLDAFTAEWFQPDTKKRSFELVSNGDVVCSLTFRSGTGTMATVESEWGNWTFKRVGFFDIKVTIREEGSEKDLAVYTPNVWGHGSLVFADGSSFAWKPSNFWGTTWMFLDKNKQPVVRFNPGQKKKAGQVRESKAVVTLEPLNPRDKKLFILINLGMYLFTVYQEDMSATTVALIAAIV